MATCSVPGVDVNNGRNIILQRAVNCTPDANGNIVWQTIRRSRSLTPIAINQVRDTFDDRDSQSGSTTVSTGIEYGDVQIELNWETDYRLHQLLESDCENERFWLYRQVVPGAVYRAREFLAQVASFVPAAPTNGRRTATATLDIDDRSMKKKILSGQPTFAT